MDIINSNITGIQSLCRKHKVKSLFAFGSVLTNKFNAQSDIDLVVIFHDAEVTDSFVNFFDFQDALESLFDRKVDLVDYSSITNHSFLQEVNTTRQLIYG